MLIIGLVPGMPNIMFLLAALGAGAAAFSPIKANIPLKKAQMARLIADGSDPSRKRKPRNNHG